jgi:hypothetical protein
MVFVISLRMTSPVVVPPIRPPGLLKAVKWCRRKTSRATQGIVSLASMPDFLELCCPNDDHLLDELENRSLYDFGQIIIFVIVSFDFIRQ